MILYKYEVQQILVTACPGLDPIDLGNGRAVCGFQLDAMILHPGRVKQELLETTRPIGWRVTNSNPLVYATIPNMNPVLAIGDRVAIQIKDLSSYAHPVTAGCIGKVLQVLGAHDIFGKWKR